ncbi:selenocysteine-specific translation elongation factor [Marinobacter sp. LN3S78]|uniref:selenocysteine-specific translation elongation factor n=1 Tax=Marinobacter sp. LN3S78 TaxID=3382300 RepID=UPI00387B595E
MIIATAGHVDHGKTTLIKALTGEDTDRLAEEKRRGLTIDLGFAWTRTEQGHWLGFVDVPGHEKFIRNMVAGVAAVDAVMLVVAADDGPMPQTREHLAILELLGVTKGLVALTRADRVDPGRLEEVRAEVTTLLAGTGLSEAPIFPVSGITGAGVPALSHWLAEQAVDRMKQPAPPQAGVRLVVDRSFTVKGSGCVVTGTLTDGCLNREDTLTVAPSGTKVRVRGLQMHGADVDRVPAGRRCAVNLSGDIDRNAISRGDWLVAPWLYQPTDRLDVRLTLQPGARLHRGALVIHIGAAAVSGRVVVLASSDDGSPLLAQLMLAAPVQACVGDRVIVRDPAMNVTLGGGEVLDPFGLRRGRSADSRTDLLAALSASRDAAGSLNTRLQAQAQGVDLDPFARAHNLTDDRLDELLGRLRPVVLRAGAQRLAFAAAHWTQWQSRLLGRLDQWHQDYPDRIGPTEAELTRLPGPHLDQPVRHRLLQALIDQGELSRSGFRFRRPGHRPRLDPTDQALLEQVLRQLEGTGLKPPIAGELAEALGLARDDMLAFLERMDRLGQLVAVAPNRFYRPESVAELAAIAVELAEQSPTGAFDARAYRDRSGIGRRLTVSVLEYLDRAGVTAFINEERRLQPAYRQRQAVTLSNNEENGYTAKP